MSERKVLNKYYPPDFDVTKLPKLKLHRDRQFVIRIMAPFSMRCKTCGDYIYKGRKFNSRMETIKDETYLGLRKYRFYIKCPKCLSEITFKTDPEKTDYEMEHGATRNFQAHKFATEEENRLKAEKEEEELNNPMKALENRTKESKLEMSRLEDLEDIKELNKRYAIIDHESLLKRHVALEDEIIAQQKAEDEEAIREAFSKKGGEYYKRINDSDSDDDNLLSTPKNREKKTSGCYLVEPYPPAKKKCRLTATSSSGSRDSLASSLANLKQAIRSKDEGGSSSTEKKSLSASIGMISAAKPSSRDNKETIGLITNNECKPSTSLGLVGDYNSSEEGSSED